MKHFGDIAKIRGCAVPITDCVIGGSPCQDLSVAGKRAGLAGARSGLFMEQIRIVKEMRYADQHSGRTGQFIRPRYMVWENVPGAFSSNGGEDFRAVLEEICRVADETTDVPGPKTGKWDTSGAVLGKRWSVAWRVLDAQFWGVPQRRRRIALVADFGGHTAPEILFERNGMCWDSAESGEARQGTAGDFEGGVKETGEAVGSDVYNGNLTGNVSATLTAAMAKGGTMSGPTICYGIGSFNSAGMLSDNPKAGIYEADTSRTLDLNGGNPACNQGGICVAQCYDMTHATDVIRECGDSTKANLASDGYAVRRLTPLECERLQGYPDGWTDIGPWTGSSGKLHKESSDSARYKALGNSIALPPWKWVLKRLCAFYERDATMASLFDGIGGFPLIWEQLNGKGSCLWASEIEEFPIAVTKRHFSAMEATP